MLISFMNKDISLQIEMKSFSCILAGKEASQMSSREEPSQMSSKTFGMPPAVSKCSPRRQRTHVLRAAFRSFTVYRKQQEEGRSVQVHIKATLRENTPV